MKTTDVAADNRTREAIVRRVLIGSYESLAQMSEDPEKKALLLARAELLRQGESLEHS